MPSPEYRRAKELGDFADAYVRPAAHEIEFDDKNFNALLNAVSPLAESKKRAIENDDARGTSSSIRSTDAVPASGGDEPHAAAADGPTADRS
jgi:hypothetical protein